jgi:DNA-binding NtrC family response regulator
VGGAFHQTFAGKFHKGAVSMKKEAVIQNTSSEKKRVEGLFDHLLEEFLPRGEMPLKEFLTYVELTLLVSSLAKSKGNQREAARILGLKHTTLNEKMKKYNLGFRKVLVFNGNKES